MWWLLRPDAPTKKTTNQSSVDVPVKWMKVDLGLEVPPTTATPTIPTPPEKPRKKSISNLKAQKNFLLREVKKPDRTALRLPLYKIEEDKRKRKPRNSQDDKSQFPVPASWRAPSTPSTVLLTEKKYAVTTIKLPQKSIVVSTEPTLDEKLKILKDEENYTPPKPKYAPEKKKTQEEHKPSEKEKNLCNWISWEIKPLIGRLEGSRRSTSLIGDKLRAKSRKLSLWHEEFNQAGGRPAKSILLHDLVANSRDCAEKRKLRSCDKEVLQPIIGHLLRVTLPQDVRATPRIDPEDQKNEIEKGGHGSSRDKLADYNMLVGSMRRQKDIKLDKEEARMLICKGVLHDNAQEYRKAVECYKEYLILCLKNGDKEGEAIAYNFLGCSLHEEQDLKLADSTDIPSTAVIQYEKAEEYHKLHAEIGNLEGKFMAHTNLGLLYANLGKWNEAAVSHQLALKCATLSERPEHQAIAVGNLAITLFRQKEWVTAKACMVKYLQICIALKDAHGQARAHYILGSISSHRKRYEEAIDEFEAAIKAAKHIKDTKLETMSKIMLGVAQGDKILDAQEY